MRAIDRRCLKRFLIVGVASSIAMMAPIAMAAGNASDQSLNQKVQSTRFDDWYYRCVDVNLPDGKVAAQCEVAQIAQVKHGDENINVLTLAISKSTGNKSTSSANGFILTALVPLNVVLPEGLGLASDGRNIAKIPYRNCNQAGCWAQLPLDQKTLARLQKGNAGEARLRMIDNQIVNLKFSLKGLTRALAELNTSQKI